MKTKRQIKILPLILAGLLALGIFVTPTTAVAKADDLIIDDSGAVTLIITGNSVLAASTGNAGKSNPEPKAPEVTKVVPIAPAGSQTTVKIDPKPSSDNKINIKIETTTKPNQPAKNTTPATSTPAKVQTVEKKVDNVILRGSDQQAVLSIKPGSAQNNPIIIQQQNVNVSTNLPLQIDTKSHIVSAETTAGLEKVSILPDQAVKGAEQASSFNSLPTGSNTNVTLTQENGHAQYTVNEERKGNLLGIVKVTIPIQVKISAETGKTTSVWYSPLILIQPLIR